MNRDTRLQALSEFLKKHRSKLQPETVGLPPGIRRRTPGLKREEVAQLAGVSTTWYTWLEQGRSIRASAQVLDRIAAALELREDERKYLFMLALDPQVTAANIDRPPEIHTALRRILKELQNCPALISDRKCHIVGWNDAAMGVFMDFGLVPEEERNMISLLFRRKELRALAVNWNDFVRGYLAIFRSYYGQYVGDPWYEEFIETLGGEFPEFRSLWNRGDVSTAPEVVIEFRHAKAGKMLFDLTSLQVHGQTDLRCSVYTPVESSDTEAKMNRLMRSLTEKSRS